MDRRVFGKGAIICSAAVLWAQPSALGSGIDECGNDLPPSPSCASENSNRQTQKDYSSRNTAATINGAPGLLPINLQWSGIHSNRLPDSMESVYSSLLKQAQAAASGDRLTNAVSAIAGVPKNSRHYEMAQQLQEDWSQELLRRAGDRYQQGNVATALSMLNAIPPTSQQRTRATELENRWNQQAERFAQATAARRTGNWQAVMDALESLQGTPLYNSLPVQNLLQQAISNRYQPDEALMQLTMPPSSEEPTVSPPEMGVPTPTTANDQASLSGESLPNSPGMAISLTEAIAWAQPPTSLLASTPAQTPERITANSTRRSMHTRLPAVTLAPPELVSALPKSSTPSSSKTTQAGNLALPELDSLLTSKDDEFNKTQ